MTGERRWYIVRCYLAPGDGEKFWDMEEGMAERLRGTELMIVGDLNVDLERTGRWGRDKEIAATVEMAGLEDMLEQFLPRQIAWNRDRRTRAIVCQGRVVWYWKEYILGSNFRIFENVAVWDPQQNPNHYMVLGCLHVASPREH